MTFLSKAFPPFKKMKEKFWGRRGSTKFGKKTGPKSERETIFRAELRNKLPPSVLPVRTSWGWGLLIKDLKTLYSRLGIPQRVCF